MTAAFDQFMREYKMTGSEKADGYSESSFIGLSANEADTVFELLKSELPWTARWLFYLDEEKALPMVKELEERYRDAPDEQTYQLQWLLLKHSGDLSYQVRMLEHFARCAESEKPHAVTYIGRTPANRATVAFFKEVILKETNTSVVARAARSLLTALELTPDDRADPNYRELIGDLRSESPLVRSATLDQLTMYEARLWPGS